MNNLGGVFWGGGWQTHTQRDNWTIDSSSLEAGSVEIIQQTFIMKKYLFGTKYIYFLLFFKITELK